VPSLEELVCMFGRGGGVSMGLIEPADIPDPTDDVPWHEDPLV